MGGRKAGEGFKVKVTCSLPIEIAEWMRDNNHSPTDILVAGARSLIKAEEKAREAKAKGKVAKNDQGPHSAEETQSYLRWRDEHMEEAKTLPLDEKFRLWRESLKEPA